MPILFVGGTEVPPMAKKRDWKKYEQELRERKGKIAEFLLSIPTKEQLLKELEKLNKRKRGRRFEIPKSILLFFHFLKHIFRIDDRLLVEYLSRLLNKIIPREDFFVHSTIVKRRKDLDLKIPLGITPEKLNGKRIYFDGMCLRVGRGGYYRSKRYHTEVRYLKIGVFTNEKGKVCDFTIGDEHDAEINMIREKMSAIRNSKPEAVVIDGAGSAKDIIVSLTLSGIKPVISASETVIRKARSIPPPHLCARHKRQDTLIWEDYARQQIDHDKWKKETGHTMRWVFSEGVFSSFKRMFGEEAVCRTQKGLHDEVCVKFLMMDGVLPSLWG